MTLNELLAKLSQQQMDHGEAVVWLEGWDTDGDWHPVQADRIEYRDGKIYIRSAM